MYGAGCLVAEAGGASAVYVLSEEGRQYAVYIRCEDNAKCGEVVLRVPEARYTVEWVDTRTGPTGRLEVLASVKGKLTLQPREFQSDIAVRILTAS